MAGRRARAFDFTPMLIDEILSSQVTKDYDAYDRKTPGLVLQLRPNGTHNWKVRVGRTWRYLGTLQTVPLAQARALAREVLGKFQIERALREEPCHTPACVGPAHHWRLGRINLLVCQTCAGHWGLGQRDPPRPLAEVGEELRRRRQAIGWTAGRLAALAEVSRTSVLYLEQGITQTYTKPVRRILAAIEKAEDR